MERLTLLVIMTPFRGLLLSFLLVIIGLILTPSKKQGETEEHRHLREIIRNITFVVFFLFVIASVTSIFYYIKF